MLFYLFYLGIKQTKNNRKDRIAKFKAQYGNLSTRNYGSDDLTHIAHYYQNHKEGHDVVDDITWNDLDMDTLFRTMNTTCSSAGEEYLYHMLRTPKKTREEVEEFNDLVGIVDQNEDQRLKLQERLSCSR